MNRLFPLLLILVSCDVADENTINLSRQILESQIVDLTYSFDSTTVFWPTAQGFTLSEDYAGHTEGGYYYEANSFSLAEHGGTHLDAPIHFAEGKQTADQIPLENLIGTGALIDISDSSMKNPDYLLSVNDLEKWEVENGKFEPETIILIRTGYGKFWPDRKAYMGTVERGPEAVADLHFPGIHPDAAQWLVQRKIKAVGIDTPSIDYGQSATFDSHQILYAANIPGFENVANLDQLPMKNFTVVALPMKIKGGSGGPLRIIALL
jgi:kynurenine formamidase